MALTSTGIDYASAYSDVLSRLNSNSQYTPQYAEQISRYNGLLDDAAANGYYDPYWGVRAQTAGMLYGGVSYDDPYKASIDEKLAALDNYGSYQSPYASQIASILDQANNYGSYQSPYASQLADLMDQAKNYGSYQSPYQGTIDGLTNELLNSKFSYDAQSDPQYQALRREYLKEAERSAANVLGMASASTGGRASSYAVSAASQAANYYKSQLNAQQQALYDSAYQRYYSDYAQRLGLLQQLGSQDQTEYGRWTDGYQRLLDSYGLYAAQDQTEYGRWTDGYQRLLDNYGLYAAQDQTEYGRWADDYNRLYNTYLAYGDQSDRAAAQYQAEYQRLQDFNDAMTAYSDAGYNRWLNQNELAAQNLGNYLTQEQLAASIANSNYANLLDMANQWGNAEAQANTERNEAYNRLLNRLLSYGATPYDYELEEAGMSRAEAERWKALYYSGLASGYSGSGSYGTSTGGYEFDLNRTDTLTDAQKQAAATAYSQNNYWTIYQNSGLAAAEAAAKTAVNNGLLTQTQASSVISAIRNYDKISAVGAKPATTSASASSGTSNKTLSKGATVTKPSTTSSSSTSKITRETK